MNTHAEYRRHGHRPPAQPPTPSGIEDRANELAHHRDPSLSATGSAAPTASKGLAWVRPTELATYAAPMVGRGIDLQAELIRRTRRTPTTTTRALRRGAQFSPEPAERANTKDGLSL